MIKLCVFDLAGTTINDDGGVVNAAFRKALEDHGYPAPAEKINQYMGMAKPLAISHVILDVYGFKPFDNEWYLTEMIHDSFVASMIDYYQNYVGNLSVDGAIETFTKLHSMDIKVALDTGFSKGITDVILHRLGWESNGLVDAVCSSDQVEHGRPQADMIRAIMSELKMDSVEQVAKIGDTPSDLQEGQNAGCGLVIGVTEGTHSKEQLEKHYHTHLIPNIKHLIPIVEATNKI